MSTLNNFAAAVVGLFLLWAAAFGEDALVLRLFTPRVVLLLVGAIVVRLSIVNLW